MNLNAIPIICYFYHKRVTAPLRIYGIVGDVQEGGGEIDWRGTKRVGSRR
jgi:hypothetical protein